MRLHQISIGEFVAAAAGPPRFRVKYKPTQTIDRELHTEDSRLVGMLCLADDVDTFIIHNGWVGGDVWSPELNGYTEEVWETVVLRSTAEAFDAIPSGLDSTHRMEWADGLIQWTAVTVETLIHHGQPVIFSVGGALAYTTTFEGAAHAFLCELELSSLGEAWRLSRSPTPSAFVLARHPTAE